VINLDTNSDAGQTINMHRAVAQQTGTPKTFITQPWAIACKHQSDECFVVSAASNIVVKVAIDPTTGAACSGDSYRQEPSWHRGQLDRHQGLRHELRLARCDRD
jgi:hypothetical protein